MSDTNTATTEYTAVIYDNTDVFSDAEEQTLLEAMEPLCEYGNICIVTLVSYDGLTYEITSNQYYDAFGDSSGMMLFIETKNSAMRIHCNGEIAETIGSSSLKDITLKTGGYAAEGKYYTCAQKVLSETQKYFFNAQVSGPMKIVSSALLAVIIGLTATYFIVRNFYGRKAAREEEVLASIYTQHKLTEPMLEHTGSVNLVKVPKHLKGYDSVDFFDDAVDSFRKF